MTIPFVVESWFFASMLCQFNYHSQMFKKIMALTEDSETVSPDFCQEVQCKTHSGYLAFGM